MTHPHPTTISARSWVGTKFHHQGRLKKTDAHRGGVDCLGLLIGVAKECELKGRSGELLHLLDETDYSHTPDVGRLYKKLCGALTRVPLQEMQEGDVVLMHVMSSPQHLGIVASRHSDESRNPASAVRWTEGTDCAADAAYWIPSCDGMTLIHAYAQAGAVIEHPLDDHWRGMIKAVFRLPSLRGV